MLGGSLTDGADRMGVTKSSPAEQDLLSYASPKSQAPAKRDGPGMAELFDESDPIGAAKGTALGVILGGLLWAVIFWAIL
jgi:hypothetical protein